ncbi:MAG: radical SAM protein [Sphaerochaetaceae bacterium]|nr:radical SAM protein [Sphaerochaetaceae bacterium]
MTNDLKKSLEAYGIKKIIPYLQKDPEKNFIKVVEWVQKHDKKGVIKTQTDGIKTYLSDPNGNWYKLIMSILRDTDSKVLATIFTNLIVNVFLLGGEKEIEYSKKYNCNIPQAILMDPTSACNLHCLGCWAADYGNKLNMDYDCLNNIIEQGTKLGTYFYIYSGGEPLVRKADIIKLCEEHPDCEFLAFTNGTLIDEKFADDMLRVKNFIPAISIEGYEESTDFRRGKGTFQAVMRAMDILKAKKLLFGASLCYTSKNTETIGSPEYFDFLIEKGCRFAWFFTYIPVGVNAKPELMVSAKQREDMYHKLRSYRGSKSLFTMDFWNDGEFVKGCIAGGRTYLHINAGGDIEPCAFIHYSDSNIHQDTLLEAYQKPLFQAYRKNQPFNCNHLRPCPLLDNNGALAKMVDESGAHSTDFESPEDVHDLCAKCKKAADDWKVVADKLWEKDHPLQASPTKKK